MSQPQIFNRLWAWSRSCKPFKGVTARLQNLGPISVTDSIYGAGSYGIMLTVTMADNRLVQNILLVSPRGFSWERELSNSAGQILLHKPPGYDGASMFEDIPKVGNVQGVMLAIEASETARSVLMTLATLNANGNVIRQASKDLTSFEPRYYSFVSTVNLGVWGHGAGSIANFTSGGFRGGLRFSGLLDLTYDGTITTPGLPGFPRAPAPACGLRMPDPDERSNLLAKVTVVGNGLDLTFQK